MLAYAENGQVQVLLGQQVYEWGSQSVQNLADKVIKGKNPSETVQKAPLVRITKENAAEFANDPQVTGGQ